MNELKQVIKKVRVDQLLGLQDLQKLSMKDVEALTEEVQHWCMYGNGDPENFGRKNYKD